MREKKCRQNMCGDYEETGKSRGGERNKESRREGEDENFVLGTLTHLPCRRVLPFVQVFAVLCHAVPLPHVWPRQGH